MNSNFTSNITFHDHEFWLQFGGSFWWSDSIGVFIMPPIVASGIFLNLLGFLVLYYGDVFQQSKIYVYLKFNFLNGFICNLTGMLYSFTVVRRFLPFANSYFALWYMNTIGLPIANVCYFYSNILDLLITLEKLSIFIKSVDEFSKKHMRSPNIICMVLFMTCLIINLPYFFFYEPSTQLVYFSPNETYVFTNYEISGFTKSHLGQAILYFQYLVRDIVPLIFLVLMNTSLIVQLNRYVRNRRVMAFQNAPARDFSVATMGMPRISSLAIVVQTEIIISKATIKARKTTINATLMVFVICLMAFVKNTIILVSIIHSSIEQGIVGEILHNLEFLLL
jgi:hypothetical protein